MSEYLGFLLSNLFVPGDPVNFDINTSLGVWNFQQQPNYAKIKSEYEAKGACAFTYSVSTTVNIPAGASRSQAMDTAFDELLPISLGCSYLTGQAVSPERSLPMSFITIMSTGDHFPRPRFMHADAVISSTTSDFINTLEAFVMNFPTLGRTEKARLLVHHWLDALACWSLEDLVLSTSTILEVIAATAEQVNIASGNTKLKEFNPRIAYAANRFSMAALPSDFRNMRNDLVHQGTLSILKFPNKSRSDCAVAVSECLNWIDSYIHAALGLGSVSSQRFSTNKYVGLNAFSID